jgi:hypothetical protein
MILVAESRSDVAWIVTREEPASGSEAANQWNKKRPVMSPHEPLRGKFTGRH